MLGTSLPLKVGALSYHACVLYQPRYPKCVGLQLWYLQTSSDLEFGHKSAVHLQFQAVVARSSTTWYWRSLDLRRYVEQVRCCGTAVAWTVWSSKVSIIVTKASASGQDQHTVL